MFEMNNEAAVEYVQEALSAKADPSKAVSMAAYMKTDMPFYGVQKAGRTQVLRRLRTDFAPASRGEYERQVLALWQLPHREEKYLAIAVARAHKKFVVPDSLPLYRRLISEGAWWDFVDEIASHLVRDLVVGFPDETWPEVDRWIDDDDMWLRRAALLCQLGAKTATDTERLFRFCLRRADETEFFIRKAIGWALREHAKTDPVAIAAFVRLYRDELSPLSFREATKHIQHLVAY